MDRSQSNVKKRYEGGRGGQKSSKKALRNCLAAPYYYFSHVIVINYVKKSGSQHLLKNASKIHIS